MTSCVGFNLAGFDVCDGFEVWTGWDEFYEECDEHIEYSTLHHRVAFCDHFGNLIGFDDDSVMESMEVGCDENCEFDCGACASLYWTGFSMFSHTCGISNSVIVVIL